MPIDVHWVALSLCRNLGHVRLQALLQHFGNSAAIVDASLDELKQVPGIGKKIANEIQTIDLAQTEKKIFAWQKADVQIITQFDKAYPSHLFDLPDPPPTIFVRGKLEDILKSVAIVGTRSPSQSAQAIAFRLAHEYAAQGYTIISGLALGIDTAAHTGALVAPMGTTMAVLGCGVLNVYPQENRELADLICQGSALLSEVDPQQTVQASHLVARNRMIAALSQQVFIIETSEQGGAMYAAKHAQSLGRTCYAWDCDASGNRNLIQNGIAIAFSDAGNPVSCE